MTFRRKKVPFARLKLTLSDFEFNMGPIEIKQCFVRQMYVSVAEYCHTDPFIILNSNRPPVCTIWTINGLCRFHGG